MLNALRHPSSLVDKDAAAQPRAVRMGGSLVFFLLTTIPVYCSPPNCVSDLVDLRCIIPPVIELLVPPGDDGGSRFYPSITSSMINLQVQPQTSRRGLRLRPEAELPRSTYTNNSLLAWEEPRCTSHERYLVPLRGILEETIKLIPRLL